MEALWAIILAFVLGFALRQVGLPPLVGFLIAGFALHAYGFEGGEPIDAVAELGVKLLLFTIGLKLRIQSLLRPEVWAGASIHMLITVIVFGLGLFGLAAVGFPYFAGLSFSTSMMIAFALSFSSTVFAVKVLEGRGEMTSLHGRTAIGILIIQDIIAVVFLAASTGKLPSPWAFALIGLLFIRPLLTTILARTGHGELMILYGLCLAVGGGLVFELVDLKADLGALIIGMLFAAHPKAEELSKAMLGFKDLFLVGFFLTVGLAGPPSFEALGIAALLTVVVPFKVALFFVLLTRFKLRARTATLASLSLANYSEFGLIVGAVGAANGWIGAEWLTIFAIALALTLALASPLNVASQAIYMRFTSVLDRFQTKTYHPEEQPVDLGPARIAILGMGRVGTAAYDFLRERVGDKVIAVDVDPLVVEQHKQAGRNVVQGSATDRGFWQRTTKSGKVGLVILTMGTHAANMITAKELLDHGYTGTITAVARYPDEVEQLEKLGVKAALNLYTEAGTAYAEHVYEQFGVQLAR